jgi:hypothetical protein
MSGHTCSMPAPLPDMKVFEWLGDDSKGVPYYLHALNLVWSDAGVEQDMELYRRVAGQLADDAAYWAEIIRSASWRHSLAGCTCLLASRRREYFDDLCHRFRAGSFIVPQIAVTLGLLHGSTARPFFESTLTELRSHPKQAVSAHRVLLRLGAQPAHSISIEEWRDFEHDDAMIADKVVAEHWDFWSNRV